ncbi:MAG: Hpt domain protein [Moraxellaceae bacterium]|jgi:HPt (histidine-containing phosphotransfer) domain-containing protein|nr:Hpt domain protein [Moraxellaceae bacterium]
MSDTYLDEALFEELRSILDTEFPALINTYIQDSAVRVADIRAAFAADSADGVRKAAHSLKGASANLGLVYLAEQCRELEDAAREGSLAGQAGRVEQVGQERERAVALLQARLQA